MAHYRTKQLGLFLYMGKKKGRTQSKKDINFSDQKLDNEYWYLCHNCLYSTLNVQIYAMVVPSKM